MSRDCGASEGLEEFHGAAIPSPAWRREQVGVTGSLLIDGTRAVAGVGMLVRCRRQQLCACESCQGKRRRKV